MINTHCKEKIEPRVGDVVMSEGFTGKVVEITSHRVNGVYCWSSREKIEKHLAQENCTLLHRPFQIGDEVEGRDYNHNWIDVEPYQEHYFDPMVRYKNPAWRDHPTWGGKDE